MPYRPFEATGFSIARQKLEYFHCHLHDNWFSSQILWSTNEKEPGFPPGVLGCHKILADCCWGWWVKWLTKGPRIEAHVSHSVTLPSGRHFSAPSFIFAILFSFQEQLLLLVTLSSSSWSCLIISHNLLPGWILLWSQAFCSGWFWEGLTLGSQMEYWFLFLFWWLFQSPQRGELSQLVLNDFREEEAKSCLFYFHCF